MDEDERRKKAKEDEFLRRLGRKMKERRRKLAYEVQKRLASRDPFSGHYRSDMWEKNKRRRNAGISIKKEEYSALMNTYIPDVEDWLEFGTNYLAVDEEDVTKAKEDFHGDELKEEILMCWIEKFGREATVSKAYELAHNFKHDELEEVFRFLVQLIPDAGEWKGFARDGLQLERDVYREHEDEITRIQQIEMLRSWRLELGENASVEKLCVALKTHFAGTSMLVSVCKAVMSPLYEGQKHISSGVKYLCEAMENVKIDVHTSGTLTAKNAYIGCHDVRVSSTACGSQV